MCALEVCKRGMWNKVIDSRASLIEFNVCVAAI